MQNSEPERGAGSQRPDDFDVPLGRRVGRAVAQLWRPRRGPPLAALCRDLDLVVDLQRCAQQRPDRLAALSHRHGGTLELWLFGVALGCAGFGLLEEAPRLLDAIPGIDAGADGRAEMLADIIVWQRRQDARAHGAAGEVTWTAA